MKKENHKINILEEVEILEESDCMHMPHDVTMGKNNLI